MSSNREIIQNVIETTCNLETLEEQIIYDVDNFKRELERQNLMTKPLEEFIDNYMRWDND